MGHGIQVFNPDGSLQFDVANRLYRRLTFVNTGTNDGAIAVSAATQGTVVAAEVTEASAGVTPRVTSSGTTVSWSFGGAPTSDRRAVTLAVGVY